MKLGLKVVYLMLILLEVVLAVIGLIQMTLTCVKSQTGYFFVAYCYFLAVCVNIAITILLFNYVQ